MTIAKTLPHYLFRENVGDMLGFQKDCYRDGPMTSKISGSTESRIDDPSIGIAMKIAHLLFLSVCVSSLPYLIVHGQQSRAPAFSLHEIGNAGDKLGQTSLVDIDRDGDLDFITGSRSGTVQWWEYRSAHQWVRHIVGHQSPTDVGGVSFDVDGDGWLDHCSGGAWWRNPGEPWRHEFQRFENGAISTHDNRAADINGDGKLDLVAMRDIKGLYWYQIPADPKTPWIEHRIGEARHSGSAVGDIDGDGDSDVVVGNWWYENRNGTGTKWKKHENIPFDGTQYNEQGIATQNCLADLDGDGDVDMAMTDGETDFASAAWMENMDGQGLNWTAHELAAGRGALHSLAIADFDNNGSLDIFTCEMAIGGSGRWYVFLNDGKGQFREHTILAGIPGHESVVGDVDLDGDIDICSKPWNGGRHIYLENTTVTKNNAERPRLVVTTDIGGDPDDLQSLIRLLVTSNELEIEGLIASASGTPGELKRNVIRPDLIRTAIERYEKVRDNLQAHQSGFPSANTLYSTVASGNPNRGIANIGAGHDTEGSNRIIQIVDNHDPRPVHIAIWGGSTDLAQALWRIANGRSKSEAREFISRIRVHAIGHQDDTGPWILKNFPSIWYTLSHSQDGNKHVSTYRGMWKHGDRALTTREWLVEHVQANHGPLGELYPLKTWSPPKNALKEGDTPSWFAFLRNDLNRPSRPDYGGWGGRFRLENGAFRDAMDTVNGETSRMATVWRWRQAFQNEFQARMDWCVKPFAEANHLPILKLQNPTGTQNTFRQIRAGETISFSVVATDPDGDQLKYLWYDYREAGTFDGNAILSGTSKNTCTLVAPDVEQQTLLHLILEVTDNGEPPLTAYQRIVVSVNRN